MSFRAFPGLLRACLWRARFFSNGWKNFFLIFQWLEKLSRGGARFLVFQISRGGVPPVVARIVVPEAFDGRGEFVDGFEVILGVLHRKSFEGGVLFDAGHEVQEFTVGFDIGGAGGTFSTPATAVRCMVEVLDPQPGDRKFLDPAVVPQFQTGA